ncbi:hypothetical protein DOY81_011385, partial [Sarcophaga bullata]
IVNMKSAVCVLLLINVVFCTLEDKWRESEDGSKFFIEKAQKYTWFQAWNDCARKNMSLIAIDSYEKYLQIGNLLRKYYNPIPDVWIAGNNYEDSLQYQWASTGKAFIFTNWHPEDPDKLKERCVRMIPDLQWRNYNCSNTYGYICEEHQAAKNICGGGGKNAKVRDELKNMNMKSVACVLLLINVVFCNVVVKWRESEDGSKFYIETATKYTWFQAWNTCARKSASLLAIDTYEKYVQIGNLLRRNYDQLPDVWIGGHNYEDSSQYQWASTGEALTFTNWYSNNPGSAKDHCIRMYTDFQWRNSNCTNKFGYICEDNETAKHTESGKDKNAKVQDNLRNISLVQ